MAGSAQEDSWSARAQEFFIVAARSHDEVTDLVRALPAWGVWGWKVKPLESFAHRAALEKKVVQELRAKK
jgi:hypothetical protein